MTLARRRLGRRSIVSPFGQGNELRGSFGLLDRAHASFYPVLRLRTTMPSVNVLLPTETINRELDFQLFLGAKLVSLGHRVFLGRQDALRALLSQVNGGVFIGKAFDPFFPGTNLDFYNKLIDRAFTILHLDEEGGVYMGDEPQWRRILLRRLDPTCLDPQDFVCTWGDFQRDVYRETRPDWAEHIRTTGHPRFDLYRKEYRRYFDEDAARIRSQYGDFVLINTNVSVANHGAGITTAFARRAGFDVSDPAKRLNHMSYWAHATQVLVSLVKLTNRLSIEFPQTQFVIRPHPSENRGFYEGIFREVPNVRVVHDGSVAPWLLASRALIHEGCTTAIEAWLSDLPIIRYNVVKDARYDRILPNRFGVDCKDEDQAVHALRVILSGQPLETPSATIDPLAESLLSNLRTEAFGKVTSVMEEAIATRPPRASQLRRRYVLHAGVATAIERAKAQVRPLFPARLRMQQYSRGKFYGFDSAGVPERIQRVVQITGTRVRHNLHGDALLRLEG